MVTSADVVGDVGDELPQDEANTAVMMKNAIV